MELLVKLLTLFSDRIGIGAFSICKNVSHVVDKAFVSVTHVAKFF